MAAVARDKAPGQRGRARRPASLSHAPTRVFQSRRPHTSLNRYGLVQRVGQAGDAVLYPLGSSVGAQDSKPSQGRLEGKGAGLHLPFPPQTV